MKMTKKEIEIYNLETKSLISNIEAELGIKFLVYDNSTKRYVFNCNERVIDEIELTRNAMQIILSNLHGK